MNSIKCQVCEQIQTLESISIHDCCQSLWTIFIRIVYYMQCILLFISFSALYFILMKVNLYDIDINSYWFFIFTDIFTFFFSIYQRIFVVLLSHRILYNFYQISIYCKCFCTWFHYSTAYLQLEVNWKTQNTEFRWMWL